VRWRQFDAVVMLVEAGADPNIHAGVEGDITPLSLAVQGNMPDIVQYLTSKGAQM
jgi:ankyrin repeat protein